MNHELRYAYILIAAGFIFCLYANFIWGLPGDLTVTFLDIGQGDSILIQTPNGRTIIVDGGPGSTLVHRLGEETSFWMKKIDALLLTHPDRDHLEGFLEVLKRYEVGLFLFTGVQKESALYKTFLKEIDERGIKTVVVAPDQDWMLDEGVFLDIIGPLKSYNGQKVEKPNNTSIVARLVYGETQLLLTGDIEKKAEFELLLHDTDLRAQILKAGHHGSSTSGSEKFLKAVEPNTAVMINGKNNSYGHPHLETVLRFDELGIDWLSTKDEGTVTFVSDEKQWRREF